MKSRYEMKRSIPALGTFFEIKYQDDGRNLSDFITSVFDEVKRLEALLNYHSDTSSLSNFNRSGIIDCMELKVLLKVSRFLHDRTFGVFDVFNPKMKRADLGGIAKGFIVDKAVKMLRLHNINGIVNAGGDMRIFGLYRCPVYIRDPFDFTENILLGDFTNIAIASSCITENTRKRGGKSAVYRKSDIVHATVIGKNCMVCDALTKVVLTSPDIAHSVLNQLGYSAIIFDKYGNKYESG